MDFIYKGLFISAGRIMSWTEYVRQFPAADSVFYVDPSRNYGATWIKSDDVSLLAYAKANGMIQDPVLYCQAKVVWQYRTKEGIQTVHAPSLEEAYKHAKREYFDSLVDEFERVVVS